MDDVYFFFFRQSVDFSLLRSVGSSGEMGFISAVFYRYRYYSRLVSYIDSVFVSIIYSLLYLQLICFVYNQQGLRCIYFILVRNEIFLFQLLKLCMFFNFFLLVICFIDLEVFISCFSLDIVDICCLLVIFYFCSKCQIMLFFLIFILWF